MGYRGEPVVIFRKPPAPLLVRPVTAPGRPPAPGQRLTTCYSGREGRDPGEAVGRSNPPIYMKYR
jgi:hypothetical protein